MLAIFEPANIGWQKTKLIFHIHIPPRWRVLDISFTPAIQSSTTNLDVLCYSLA